MTEAAETAKSDTADSIFGQKCGTVLASDVLCYLAYRTEQNFIRLRSLGNTKSPYQD